MCAAAVSSRSGDTNYPSDRVSKTQGRGTSSTSSALPTSGAPRGEGIGLARPELRSHLHLFSVSYPKRSFNIELKQPSRIEYPPDLAKPSFRQAWGFQIVRGR